MDTNRMLELLLASAVRDRAARYLDARIPDHLPTAEQLSWRQAHWTEALGVAREEFIDVARWLRQQDAADAPPSAGGNRSHPGAG